MALETDVKLLGIAHVAMLNVKDQIPMIMELQNVTRIAEKFRQKMLVTVHAFTQEQLELVRLDVLLLVDVLYAMMEILVWIPALVQIVDVINVQIAMGIVSKDVFVHLHAIMIIVLTLNPIHAEIHLYVNQ